jgi:hypothetical protein
MAWKSSQESLSAMVNNRKINMRKLQVAILAASLVGAMSVSASMTVSLVPDTLNVAPGSTVNVSVNLSGSEGFTMTAISAVILYDPKVFTYVDQSAAQGGFLRDDWTGDPTWPIANALLAGDQMQLRVGMIDWTDFNGEALVAGNGTLFTFTLLANANAPLGLSALSWGDAGNGVGFDYGDAGFQDVILPSSGVTINISTVPEPTTMIAGALLLLPFGASTLRILRKRQTA